MLATGTESIHGSGLDPTQLTADNKIGAKF